MAYLINLTCVFNDIMPSSSLLSINIFFGCFTGIQAGVEMIEQMVKERSIPDLKGSESPEFLKIDYMNYKLIK